MEEEPRPDPDAGRPADRQDIAGEEELEAILADVKAEIDTGVHTRWTPPIPPGAGGRGRLSSAAGRATASQRASGSGHEQAGNDVREAVNEAIAEEMRRDPRVFLLGEDVAEAGHPFKR